MSSARLGEEQIPCRGETGPTLVKALFGQVVFSVGEAEYRWEDVVLAAELWGDWARVRDRVREGVSCLRRADEEEASLAAEEIESAANEFRYARDLVAGEEMERWLERWSLTAESWMDWVAWSLLRQKWSDDLAELVSEYGPAEEEVDDLLQTEAVCSGELARLAHELAGRAAVYAREEEERQARPGSELDATAILQKFPPALAERGLPGISLEASRARMEDLARLELSFRRFRERVLTPGAVEAKVRSSRTDWTRLDYQSISFRDEEAAREAALCVREDGEGLDQVAGDANLPVHRERVYIEETDPELRGRFLGAQKGELIGPVKSGDEFVLHLVLDKVLPSGSDPDIAARASEAIVESLVEPEINDRVKWRVQL